MATQKHGGHAHIARQPVVKGTLTASGVLISAGKSVGSAPAAAPGAKSSAQEPKRP